MDTYLLQDALREIKTDLEKTIRTASYKGNRYENGLNAKTALIRSQSLILKVHEIAKVSLYHELMKITQNFSIHPPLGKNSPEVVVFGQIKGKKQDIVVLFGDNMPEKITDGPFKGAVNALGKEQSESAIVIGVRSQLSSVVKNYDTLMERAFAETLNLRLRLPRLVMGEIYMIPLVEYDDQAMKNNVIAWKNNYVPVERFVKTFLGITNPNRNARAADEAYKYERTALIVVDFRKSPPKILSTLEELKAEGCVSPSFQWNFSFLSPKNFASDIVKIHRSRHALLY